MGFAGFAAVANLKWAGRRGIYFCLIRFEVDEEGFHVTGKGVLMGGDFEG
jgi:hypothetical protein